VERHPQRAWRGAVAGLLVLVAGVVAPPGAAARSTPAVRAAARINGQGLALHRVGSYGPAIDKFREALRLDPDHVVSQYNLACALALDGQQETALVELQRLRERGCAACRAKLARARIDEDLRGLWALPAFQAVTSPEPAAAAPPPAPPARSPGPPPAPPPTGTGAPAVPGLADAVRAIRVWSGVRGGVFSSSATLTLEGGAAQLVVRSIDGRGRSAETRRARGRYVVDGEALVLTLEQPWDRTRQYRGHLKALPDNALILYELVIPGLAGERFVDRRLVADHDDDDL